MPRKRTATTATTATTTAPTPSTSINSLSPEVLDLILDQICNDERLEDDEIIWVLGKCRRLSRLFNSLATSRVFKEVHFHCFGWTYRDHSQGDAAATRHSKKFLLLLEANPALATHVRIVEITSRTGSRSWFGRSKALPQILPQLVNVQRLCIEVYNGSALWRKLYADVAKAFQDAFRAPNLRTLEVMNIDYLPLDLLLVAASKVTPKSAPKPLPAPQKSQAIGTRRSARIKDATPKSSAPTLTRSLLPPSPPAQVCGLDSLTLCAGTLRYSTLDPNTDVASKKDTVYTINKLKLSFNTEYFAFKSFADLSTSWRKLVTRLGASLKEVEIGDKQGTHKPGKYFPFVFEPFLTTICTDNWPSGDHLSGLTCLETLTMFAAVSSMRDNTHNIDFPLGFARTLKSKKPITSIQTIRLIFSVSIWIQTCPMWCLTKGWDELPALLSSVAPNLRTLVLQFQTGNFIHAGSEPTRTLDEMKNHFREVLSPVKVSLPSITVKVIMVEECDFVV
ncbi:hypothetical protein BJ165DRAFT_164691 [Panaeolus papilionaceus]|nr:hypothetical protein BJ165DRAFT_164691 [Panaeolus papilionaceus]